MRILPLVCLFAMAGPAVAGPETDNLFRVLEKYGCATTAPTGGTSADAICRGTAYDYCSRAADQTQCSRYFPQGGPRAGEAFAGTITASAAAQVRTEAERIVNDKIAKYETLAQTCCGDSPDACQAQLPAGSPAALGQQQISRNLVATRAEAAAADQTGASVRGTQGASSMNFGYATDAAAGLAGACKSTKAMCQERFAALAKSVKDKVQRASGAEQTQLNQLVTDLEGRAQRCEALSPARAERNTELMAGYKAQAEGGKLQTASAGSSAQGTKATKEGAGSGMDASMLSSLAPMLGQMMNQQDPSNQASAETPAAPDCSNPATAGCYQAASTGWAAAAATGDAGVAAAAAGGGAYNVADTSGVTQAAGFVPPGGGQGGGAPVTVGGVPGGGGGFAGGVGAGGAVPGGGGGGGGARGASVNTDIMHGEGGGGGLGAMNASMSTAAGGSSGGYTYGRGAGGGGGDEAPAVDWRQFLPGGAKDPTRKLAGAAARSEIQSAQVNIWNRVSERIRARCAQGLLRDCN